MAALEQASKVTQLRSKGNAEFGTGKFVEAEETYTEAIALDGSIEALWSNRAAARLKLGKNAEALADANSCIELKPAFLKGYHRKALALKAMGDERGSYETYVAAVAVCEVDAWLNKEMAKAKKNMLKSFTEKKVDTTEQMVYIFSSLEDLWDRLSTLAYFWNTSTRPERYAIFARLLAIGRTPEKIHEFEHEHMNSMTTKNYEEMGRFPNPHWIAFFVDLEEEAKVTCLEGMWKHTSVEEKDAIIKDLQHFCANEGDAAEEVPPDAEQPPVSSMSEMD